MALVNPYNPLSPSAFLNTIFAPEVSNLISHSNPVLSAIKKTQIVDRDIRFVVQNGYGASSTTTIADGAAYSVPAGLGSDYGQAVFNWVTFIDYVDVGAQTAQKLVGGQISEFADLMLSAIRDKAKQMSNYIANELFLPNNASGFIGIPDIISATNTLGTIDRSLAPNAGWRSTILDAAGAPLSTNLFNNLDNSFYQRTFMPLTSSGQFTAVCSSNLYTRFQRLFTSIDLASLSTAHFLNRVNQSGQLAAPEITPSYQSVPIMRTPEYRNIAGDTVGTERMYFLNMNELEIAYLPPVNAINRGDTLAGGKPGLDGNIPVELVILPRTRESFQIAIRTTIQTICRNPKFVTAGISNILL
jgi:hypothetical protein